MATKVCRIVVGVVLLGGMIWGALALVVWICRPPGSGMSRDRFLVASLGVALDQYHFVFGEYPPDASEDTRFDLPSECLVYYLGTAFRRAPDAAKGEVAAAKNGGPHFDFRNEYLIDTDGDGLMEIVDMWGRLFLYDRSPEEADYPGQELGEEPYNLWSRGINGVDEFGCGDDISSWRSE